MKTFILILFLSLSVFADEPEYNVIKGEILSPVHRIRDETLNSMNPFNYEVIGERWLEVTLSCNGDMVLMLDTLRGYKEKYGVDHLRNWRIVSAHTLNIEEM